MWKCAGFPFLSITVGRGKVASRLRRSQMASKSMAGGRNTALYQRLSCLPTHRQRERGESTSMRVDGARVDDWEVHSVPSSSVRDSVNQRKHKDQTVLQVVLEAQLCANFTGNVLFSLWLGEWGVSNFRRIQYIWKRMGKASPSGFPDRIVSQRGCGCDTRRETALPLCLEQRKWVFKVFSSLGQLYMRVLLKHLTPLWIQCHINLAPWPPRQLWCEPSGQATLMGARLQMTGSSH